MTTDFKTLDIPFCRFVGIEAKVDAEGQTICAVEIRAEIMNNFAVAHGGVIVTLLDVAMTRAAAMSTEFKGVGMTSDLSVQFVRPATGRVVAIGKVTHSGRSLIFCEAEARNAEGLLLAKSHGTIFLIRGDGTQAARKHERQEVV